MEHASAVTYAHAAPVVEKVTPAPTGAVDDPSVSLITDLLNKSQPESPSEARHKPHSEDESAKVWDPETQAGTHSSRHPAVKKFGARVGEDPCAHVKATVTQRQAPVVQTVQKISEVHQIRQCLLGVVDVPAELPQELVQQRTME